MIRRGSLSIAWLRIYSTYVSCLVCWTFWQQCSESTKWQRGWIWLLKLTTLINNISFLFTCWFSDGFSNVFICFCHYIFDWSDNSRVRMEVGDAYVIDGEKKQVIRMDCCWQRRKHSAGCSKYWRFTTGLRAATKLNGMACSDWVWKVIGYCTHSSEGIYWWKAKQIDRGLIQMIDLIISLFFEEFQFEDFADSV